MKPDIGHIYAVLRQWAIAGEPRTYTQLSLDYHARTGEWFEPHGSWGAPLGELNNHLASVGAPALSALVTLKETNRPGGEFWGCAPNVPPRPKNDDDRDEAWCHILDSIGKFDWPTSLP